MKFSLYVLVKRKVLDALDPGCQREMEGIAAQSAHASLHKKARLLNEAEAECGLPRGGGSCGKRLKSS